ncbi:ficolin-1-like [Drosophila innubila]|uniref:ficolin-1-like n=1 Tax=Drosophila innubila TaxID=198719 RepID=UPI00148D9A36|nr:ficolin-1-like [Drosophila innubila]
MDGLVTKSDIQDLISGLQSLRAEQKRQGTLIEGLFQLYKQNLKSQPGSCTDAKSTGIHEILLPKFSSQPFEVSCDAKTQGGGWTIILRRRDGSVDFNRNWAAYKEGFGDLSGEFFLGLDKIHALTKERNQELLVVLEDFKGFKQFELYKSFAIGDEDQQYVLHTLGEASGTAGDLLSVYRSRKFTTYDRDNDNESWVNCAKAFSGGWWDGNCFNGHLTGKYNDKGIRFLNFRTYEHSFKTAAMMIRPNK